MKPGDEKHNCFLLPLCLQLEEQPNVDLGQDYGGIYCVVDSEHQFLISYVYFKVQATFCHLHKNGFKHT